MENTIIEATTEDKIAKLKTTLEGMELLGATIPQAVKDAVTQELSVLEAEALATLQAAEAKAVSEAEIAKTKASEFLEKNRTVIIIVAVMFVLHVAGKFGW